ncbi:lysophosphatidylcholine acyltransferase 1 isoform X1 [Tachysurus ichikawai]
MLGQILSCSERLHVLLSVCNAAERYGKLEDKLAFETTSNFNLRALLREVTLHKHAADFIPLESDNLKIRNEAEVNDGVAFIWTPSQEKLSSHSVCR